MKFLFKDVIKIVAPWHRGNFHYNNGRPYFDTDESELKAFVLNCRLVCRAWDKCICDIVHEIFLEDRKPYYNLNDLRSVFGFINKAYEFTTTENIDNFLKIFNSSTLNPFCNGTIFLIVPPTTNHFQDDHNDKIFHDKTDNMLTIFGKFVNNCEIRLTRMFTTDMATVKQSSNNRCFEYDLKQTYLKLLDLLEAMPSLKILRIRSKTSKILETSLETSRMPPTLENIQRLEMYNVGSTMCNAIVRQNVHVNEVICPVLSPLWGC